MCEQVSRPPASQNCSWNGLCGRSGTGLKIHADPNAAPWCVARSRRGLCAPHASSCVLKPHARQIFTAHRCRCNDPAQDPPCDGPQWCYNSCRGKGRCVKHTCVCDEGFWGMDCSSTLSPEGRPVNLLAAGPGFVVRCSTSRSRHQHATCLTLRRFTHVWPRPPLAEKLKLRRRRSRTTARRQPGPGFSCTSSRRSCPPGTSASRAPRRTRAAPTGCSSSRRSSALRTGRRALGNPPIPPIPLT